MDQITIEAPAKVNLALWVGAAQPDGYHRLLSVMQTLRLADVLTIKKINAGFRFYCDVPGVPPGGENIAYRAVRHLIEAYSVKYGLEVALTKRIPVAAGLGGGSADCAAALVGVNTLCGLGITRDEMLVIGRRFGADVPFCIVGGTCLAEGAGEELTQWPAHPPVWVVLAKPAVAVSTREAYAWLDQERHEQDEILTPHLPRAIHAAIAQSDAAGIARSFHNDFLPIINKRHPIVGRLIERMLGEGAMGASMSGSGPAVFGYFDTRQAAESCLNVLRKVFMQLADCIITETYNAPRGGL